MMYCCCCCWSLLDSAVLRSRADSLRSHVILHEWLTFYSAFLNIHRSGVLTALTWLVPRETAAVSAQDLFIPYNHATCHFMQSHIPKVRACLAAAWHLHFWQNDRGLLRATAVTREWNEYRKILLPSVISVLNAYENCGLLYSPKSSPGEFPRSASFSFSLCSREKSETRMISSVLKQDPNTDEVSLKQKPTNHPTKQKRYLLIWQDTACEFLRWVPFSSYKTILK